MDNQYDCERGACGHDHELEALRDAAMATRLYVFQNTPGPEECDRPLERSYSCEFRDRVKAIVNNAAFEADDVAAEIEKLIDEDETWVWPEVEKAQEPLKLSPVQYGAILPDHAEEGVVFYKIKERNQMKVFSKSTKVLLVGVAIGYGLGATYGWALAQNKK